MRKPKLLLVLPAILAIQTTFAQSSHLKLSNEYPAANEKVTMTYDPKGTLIEGKTEITASVYFVAGKRNPAIDVDFKTSGSLLTTEFTIPDSTKAFFVKVYNRDDIDDNNGKGYMYPVYKDKKPVEGAYESEGYVMLSGIGLRAKIKPNPDSAFVYLKKEAELYPEWEMTYKTQYYLMLARKTQPEDIALTDKEIALLQKSDKESDLMLATSLLTLQKKKPMADSLRTLIKQKFPDGAMVNNGLKSTAFLAAYKESDLAKKDSLAKIYISKYPDDKNYADVLNQQLASGYLGLGNKELFNKYIDQVYNKQNLASYYNNLAYGLAMNNKELEEAQILSKRSLDLMEEKMKDTKPLPFISPKDAYYSSKATYGTYADSYGTVLLKQGKNEEALKYLQPLYKGSGTYHEVLEHYATALNGAGKYTESKKVIEDAILAGKGTSTLNDELKKSYVGIHGSDAGYKKYAAPFAKAEIDHKTEDMVKQMLNDTAAPFALKDMDGNTVSLASLKGKTVVIDFWATWCGPCKASFPAMQMAVNKYKNDPNVKFLFIDTWERDTNYVAGVKKFITDNKYSFHVLYDEKGADGQQSKVKTQYPSEGIPTKFIIDKNGTIKFKVVGGAPSKLLDEVSAMIDILNKPEPFKNSDINIKQNM